MGMGLEHALCIYLMLDYRMENIILEETISSQKYSYHARDEDVECRDRSPDLTIAVPRPSVVETSSEPTSVNYNA